MNQIYVDGCLGQLLDKLVVPGFNYRLFTNNLTPSRTTVIGDLSEATWAGYAAVDVLAADWLAFGVAGHHGSKLANAITFLNSSGGDVNAYGYYAIEIFTGELAFAARFDSAPVTRADGESYVVIPVLGDFSQFST